MSDDDFSDDSDRRPADISEDDRHVRQVMVRLHDQILDLVCTSAREEAERGYVRTAEVWLTNVLLDMLVLVFEAQISASPAAREECRRLVWQLSQAVEHAAGPSAITHH